MSTNEFDTLSGQTGCISVILYIECTGQEEAATDNTHEARHVQCKLQAGVVRHKISVTKMQQETVCDLRHMHTYHPRHQHERQHLTLCIHLNVGLHMPV